MSSCYAGVTNSCNSSRKETLETTIVSLIGLDQGGIKDLHCDVLDSAREMDAS
jgi:hypothetical protein